MVERFGVYFGVAVKQNVRVQEGDQRLFLFAGFQVSCALGVIGAAKQLVVILGAVLGNDILGELDRFIRVSQSGRADGLARLCHELLLGGFRRIDRRRHNLVKPALGFGVILLLQIRPRLEHGAAQSVQGACVAMAP